MDTLVLHEDELDNFALDLANEDASQFENVQSAPLVENGLAHIVKGPIVEHYMGHIQLSNRA